MHLCNVTEYVLLSLNGKNFSLVPLLGLSFILLIKRMSLPHFGHFLGTFAKLRKATGSFVVCVCPFAWNN
jgi:hypothetical protein